MKKIGLIGGISWESSAVYYQHLNRMVNQKLGGLHSAELLMHSVDFVRIKQLQDAGDWQQVGHEMSAIALNLQNAGADLIVIACNTMHIVTKTIESILSIPLLHIVDPTANSIVSLGLSKVGLLGTMYTTQGTYFTSRLRQEFNIEAIVPDERDCNYMGDIIREEFCRGIFRDETRQHFLQIIDRLKVRGAEGVILGCTEIPILIRQSDCEIPVFDTAYLHAAEAVEFALSN